MIVNYFFFYKMPLFLPFMPFIMPLYALYKMKNFNYYRIEHQFLSSDFFFCRRSSSPITVFRDHKKKNPLLVPRVGRY